MTGSWDLIGPALWEGLQSDGATSLKGLAASVAARPEHAALLGAAAYAQRDAPTTVGPSPGVDPQAAAAPVAGNSMTGVTTSGRPGRTDHARRGNTGGRERDDGFAGTPR